MLRILGKTVAVILREIYTDENRIVHKAKIPLEGRYVTKRCHLHPRHAVTQR